MLVLGLNYLLIMITVCFKVDFLYDAISARLWFDLVLYFSLKNIFCENFSILINSLAGFSEKSKC